MKVKNGDSVKVHYIGTLNDGNEFDNSYKRGNTLDFQVGGGQMIKGFDNALVEMEVGEKKSFEVQPEYGYGEYKNDLLVNVPVDKLPDGIEEGSVLQEGGDEERLFTVKKIKDAFAILDANHPLAGQILLFDIELVSITPS